MEDELDIIKMIVGFYETLYKSKGGDFNGVKGLNWCPISALSVELLEKPFEESEIKNAMVTRPLDQMVSLSFFQDCWDFVKSNVRKALDEF